MRNLNVLKTFLERLNKLLTVYKKLLTNVWISFISDFVLFLVTLFNQFVFHEPTKIFLPDQAV